MALPTDPKARKALPVATGVLDYFPDALMAVAELSRLGNDQHNPGQPLHWSRGKSNDHPDCLIRHFLERGTVDTDGVRHSAKVAWRALAILQLEIEAGRANAASRHALWDWELWKQKSPSSWQRVSENERHTGVLRRVKPGGDPTNPGDFMEVTS